LLYQVKAVKELGSKFSYQKTHKSELFHIVIFPFGCFKQVNLDRKQLTKKNMSNKQGKYLPAGFFD
jgi:hypothetical protein